MKLKVYMLLWISQIFKFNPRWHCLYSQLKCHSYSQAFAVFAIFANILYEIASKYLKIFTNYVYSFIRQLNIYTQLGAMLHAVLKNVQ